MSICINHFYLSACRKPMFHICVHLISTLFENMYMSWLFHRLDAYEMFHITATLKIHFPLPWFSSSMLLSDAIVSLHFHSDGFWTARTLYGKWITRKDFSGLLWRFFFGFFLKSLPLSDLSTIDTVSHTTDTWGLTLISINCCYMNNALQDILCSFI